MQYSVIFCVVYVRLSVVNVNKPKNGGLATNFTHYLKGGGVERSKIKLSKLLSKLLNTLQDTVHCHLKIISLAAVVSV